MVLARIEQVNQKGDYTSIVEALDEPCAQTEGYDISLIDYIHKENLEINQSLPVNIQGMPDKNTNWGLLFPYDEIVLLEQGNLTLVHIEFDFSYQKNISESVLPSRYLICIRGTDYLPSLTMVNCVLKSISGISEYNMFQIQANNLSEIFLYDCMFIGIGTQEATNTSLVLVSNCSEVTVKNCIFQNASFISGSNALAILVFKDNSSITIQDSQFNNIISNGQDSTAALSILGFASFKAAITWSNFTNCRAVNSSVGALLIMDSNNHDVDYLIKITNNIFTNNHGNYSGAILIGSENSSSNYIFSYNKFKSNKNNQKKEKGRDAYLSFNKVPDTWTLDILTKMIKDWFNGSTTNALKNSIYFDVYKDEKVYLSGTVTLPKSSDAKKIDTEIVIGIVGLVILIAVIVAFVVIIVYCRKKKQKSNDSQNENKSLLDHPYQESK